MVNDAVKSTPELRRVRDLPRRQPFPNPADAAELNEILRTATGRQKLRPLQALALLEILAYGGAFCPLGVGEGKTLITLLAPLVLDAQRPLLLLPANLIKKTQRDQHAAMRDWRVPRHTMPLSYELLGRHNHADDLEKYKPDLIIADEAHKLKNLKAAVTRRVSRYMKEHPETRFIALSGTFMRKSVMEFGPVLRWCIKEHAPIPRTDVELAEWAAALDEETSAKPGDDPRRLEPGALLELCTPDDRDENPRTAARRGFRRRLIETPGVIASSCNGERVDCSIHVAALKYDVQPVTEAHFRRLRETWELPSGEALSEAVAVWRHARELALGLHYEWNPPAPETWLAARRAWAALVRDILSRSRTLDSELQVAQAIDAGGIRDHEAESAVLEAWRKIKPTFKPNPVPVWHDDSAIKACAAWGKTPGIIWTEHYFFAQRLSRETGFPYFGAEGLDAQGRFIDDAPNNGPIIASIKANREGRNLQVKWSRNLVVSPPEGADVWEQMIGRTHRPGQTADEVTLDVLLGCAEHANAWRKAVASARAVRDTTGAEQKLLIADIEWPTDLEINRYRGARWTGTKERD